MANRIRLFTLVSLSLLSFNFARADDPAYWSFAQKPPMGWNSYDAFGSSVTEAEVLANATYMKEHLAAHGWQYVVIDYRWYDPAAAQTQLNGKLGQPLEMDNFGRLCPAPNRFPSAANGVGFKALADQVHAMGLKFGIHVMRGIPRQAVAANSPIEGSNFHAVDAANQKSQCGWCKDMYGVQGDTPAGQAYYDSLFRLYASWNLDFVKVDDLSSPYSTHEIEAIRSAIDKCGRPIVFSTSPGETPVKEAAHVSTHANMWRISGDFWDNWNSLNHGFDLGMSWKGVGGPGHWPDFDMLPIGKIGIRSVGHPRNTAFTQNEQKTLISFWCIQSSPLMLGNSLTDSDDSTLQLITNDAILAIDQDSASKPATRIWKEGDLEAWSRDLSDGSKVLGLFNRGKADAQAKVDATALGLTADLKARDLWLGNDIGTLGSAINQSILSHGVLLFRLTK